MINHVIRSYDLKHLLTSLEYLNTCIELNNNAEVGLLLQKEKSMVTGKIRGALESAYLEEEEGYE
jgi:hypothetical protein